MAVGSLAQAREPLSRPRLRPSSAFSNFALLHFNELPDEAFFNRLLDQMGQIFEGQMPRGNANPTGPNLT